MDEMDKGMAVPVYGTGAPALKGMESSDILSRVLVGWVRKLQFVVINFGTLGSLVGSIEEPSLLSGSGLGGSGTPWDKTAELGI